LQSEVFCTITLQGNLAHVISTGVKVSGDGNDILQNEFD
jgi:hypothetical protein